MTKEELKAQREHDKRINYQKACRKIIQYQIDNWKIDNNVYATGKTMHLDHIIPFALMVDCFRELIKTYHSSNKLPTIISDLSSVGQMFMKYHALVAEYELIHAKDNLSKASGQTRSKDYGLDINTFKLYASKCRKIFLQLTDGVEVAIQPKRIIKDLDKGRALQEY